MLTGRQLPSTLGVVAVARLGGLPRFAPVTCAMVGQDKLPFKLNVRKLVQPG